MKKERAGSPAIIQPLYIELLSRPQKASVLSQTTFIIRQWKIKAQFMDSFG